MARGEVTGQKPDAQAFTVAEFCQAHRISESFYYKLKARGLGPVETKLLSKTIITNENAKAWRTRREELAQSA
jgi:hypothetical protein